MRIAQLRPHFFRAFADSAPILFDPSFTIFYGGNGTGKSSLSEAIEWLLYGYTKRRRKGDEYSRNEYKGSYVNSTCPLGVAPYVEAELLFRDGTTHTLRREISLSRAGTPQDTDSMLSLDASSIPDLAALGIPLAESHCPVIVQHGIQDFIHTRPIDRYRVISEALGLNDLVRFKDVFEKAKNILRNNPSPELVHARSILNALAGHLNAAGMQDVAARWLASDFTLAQDYAAIAIRARQLCMSDAPDFAALLSALRTRQAEEIARLFDIGPYRASDEGLLQCERGLKTMQEDGPRCLEEVKALGAGIPPAMQDASHGRRLALWRQGLLLTNPAQPDQCPLCGATTLTAERRAHLELQLKADAEMSALRVSFEKACERLRNILNDVRTALQTLRLARIQPGSIDRLHQLAPDLRSEIAAFVNANHAIAASADAFIVQTGTYAAALAALPGILHDPGQFNAQIDALPPYPEDLLQQLAHIIEGLPAYAAATAAFQVVLAANLSNQENVVSFNALVELLQATRSVSLLAAATSLERRLLDAQRAMDQYVLDRQNQAVAAREVDMLAWYSRLSPNPDVRFSGLQPGRNEIALKAEAFGQELNAAAALSQSQLNCLGLSIYIPCVTDPGSPFHFIVFDDPVQAMDDDHHEAFLVNVIPQLLDVAKAQTIVLTHLRDTADRLRDCNYARDYLYYNFDRLQITGPVIVENIVLTDDMKKVRTLAEGNDDARDLAVDRIRVTCEHIMREAYFRAVGTRMPLTRGTAGQMVPFFGQVTAVTPRMLADIQDTINWSSPAHHSQPGYSPPVSANIRPHIERLQRMINDLGLKT